MCIIYISTALDSTQDKKRPWLFDDVFVDRDLCHTEL